MLENWYIYVPLITDFYFSVDSSRCFLKAQTFHPDLTLFQYAFFLTKGSAGVAFKRKGKGLDLFSFGVVFVCFLSLKCTSKT